MKKLLLFVGMIITFLCVFAQTEVPRYTLIEVFTSSTCPPCTPANANLKNILAQNDAQGGKYTLIKYQMNWPGTGDPYYTTEGNTRRGVYGLNSVPYLLMDASYKSSPTHAQLLAAQAVASNVEITGTFTVHGETVNATVHVRPTVNISEGNNLRLYVAIVEKRTERNKKTNGESEFFQVMKKFMPDANGIALGNLTANQIVTQELSWIFKGEYRLPANANSPINHSIEHSIEHFHNLEVVAWVQHTGTKAIYNSGTPVNETVFNTVNYSVVNGNGSLTAKINGSGALSINSGTNIVTGSKAVEFTASPNECYKVKEWKLNGVVVAGNTTNNFSHVAEGDIDVTVEFEKNLIVATYSVINGNGTITATTNEEPFNSGDGIDACNTVKFTATPNLGYKVKEWRLNGNLVPGNTSNTYSLLAKNDVTVTVEFKEADSFSIMFNVTNGNGALTATVNGESIGNGDKVFEGSTVEFTAIPDENYEVKEWKRNNVVVPDNITNYYATTISAETKVTVEFMKSNVGIIANEANDVELFPNPFTNELTICNAAHIQKVTITNAIGQIVKEDMLTGNQTAVISTHHLQSGVYFVTLKNNEGAEITQKIVKK
jgi:hypothetical protein